MLERSELALKILCGAILALVLYRLILVIAHINPLYHLTIPALPSLPVTAAVLGGGTATNSHSGTKRGTNLIQSVSAVGVTNVALGNVNSVPRSNTLAGSATNSLARAGNSSSSDTNFASQITNQTVHATNSVAQSTNSSPALTSGGPGSMRRVHDAGNLAVAGGPMPGRTKPGPDLPPEIQARIDRVIDSEIIAPVIRPLPMALLGIAGNDVFLRAPNGQTGLIKEGEELGGVKLIRIGTNRVLVEQQGERKELTIFAGLGGESLLSTQKDNLE
jgi:hypothetical protein